MNVVVALIVFSALGAVICARARAAGPALFFGVVAVALLAATPLGEQLREGVESVIEAGQQAAAESGAR
ncbi:MAG: hypothetical protein GEU83_03225 [Pseudonocardiaceae bacterium]|nr:hypothetical protein [Pseudonocardiaceae bacterium]